jgi:endoglucanase
VAVYNTQTVDACGRVISPYLDNRVSCLVLLMAMEKLGTVDNDLYFVFTAQEEVGIRGAKTAAWAIDPDYGIAVDVTASDDEPGSKHLVSSVFGGGAAVKVMDSSVICHPQMVDKLMSLAEEKGIKAQRDVIRAGGTDAGAIHLTRAGVYTGGISIPCRYIHTPTEMVERTDVEACVRLVTAFAQTKLEHGV